MSWFLLSFFFVGLFPFLLVVLFILHLLSSFFLLVFLLFLLTSLHFWIMLLVGFVVIGVLFLQSSSCSCCFFSCCYIFCSLSSYIYVYIYTFRLFLICFLPWFFFHFALFSAFVFLVFLLFFSCEVVIVYCLFFSCCLGTFWLFSLLAFYIFSLGSTRKMTRSQFWRPKTATRWSKAFSWQEVMWRWALDFSRKATKIGFRAILNPFKKEQK